MRPSYFHPSYARITNRIYASSYTSAFTIAAIVAVALLVDTPVLNERNTDFFYNFYCIGKLIALGYGSHIYDPAFVGHWQRVLVAPIPVPRGVLPNVYPPVVGVAFAPLGALPYGLAYALWMALNCALLAWNVAAWERYIHLRGVRRLAWRFLTILSVPIVVALLQGQLSIVLLTSLSVSFFAYANQRYRTAGAFLALTLIKPQFTFPLLAMLMLQRNWQAVRGFAAVASAVFVVPLVCLGPGADGQFVNSLWRQTSLGANSTWSSPNGNQGFSGFFQVLLSRPASTIVIIAAISASLLLLCCVAVKSNEHIAAFALAIIVAVLVAPHVLIHDLTLLMIPAGVIVRTASGTQWTTAAVLSLGYVTVGVGFLLQPLFPAQVATIGIVVWAVCLTVQCAPENTDL